MRFALVLLLVSIPALNALKCYVCNENEQSACADAGSIEKFLKECPKLEDPYCRKIDQSVDGKTTVVRSCGSKMGTKACYKTAGKNNANVCSCNTDGCNHAASVFGYQQWVSIASLLIGLVMLR